MYVACIYVYLHTIHTYVYIYICDIYMYIYLYTHINVYMYVCMHTALRAHGGPEPQGPQYEHDVNVFLTCLKCLFQVTDTNEKQQNVYIYVYMYI